MYLTSWEKKQKIIILLDYSGSMNNTEKQFGLMLFLLIDLDMLSREKLKFVVFC
jgi:uncharacterized protein with von Willebrand factor type A (vWA) domain